jgi:hypothetical protein
MRLKAQHARGRQTGGLRDHVDQAVRLALLDVLVGGGTSAVREYAGVQSGYVEDVDVGGERFMSDSLHRRGIGTGAEGGQTGQAVQIVEGLLTPRAVDRVSFV